MGYKGYRQSVKGKRNTRGVDEECKEKGEVIKGVDGESKEKMGMGLRGVDGVEREGERGY